MDKQTDHSHGGHVTCIECENVLHLHDRSYEVGDVVECNVCGTEMEVVSVKDGEMEVEVLEEEK